MKYEDLRGVSVNLNKNKSNFRISELALTNNVVKIALSNMYLIDSASEKSESLLIFKTAN